MGARLDNALRRLRAHRGLSQRELGHRAGISRQALGALESGRSVPSLPVALRLAASLGASVDELFSLPEPATAVARLARAAQGAAGAGRERVLLAEIEGLLVAHPLRAAGPLSLFAAADGVVERARRRGAEVRVRPLRPRAALRERLLAAGCDPALSLLSGRLPDRAPDARLSWLPSCSRGALAMLARGEVHLAGTHLRDEESGQFNVPAVRAAFPGRAMLVVALARWEQGLAVARGNPLGLRRPEDLARPGVRIVNREAGAGARAQLDAWLRAASIRPEQVAGYRRTAEGHLEVAQAVAGGGADAGVTTRAAAAAHGLSFLPLAQERFDLVLPLEAASDPRVDRLLATLRSRAVRRELGSLPGYSAADAGDPVAELPGSRP